MSDVLLEAKDIKRSFMKGDVLIEVIRGISFSIREGEMVCITGMSGAGKSTLLNLLGTLDRPTSGSVLFQKEDLFKRNETQLADFRNRNLGFVFQFHYLLPEFSAVENVMMPALIARKNRDWAHKRACELLESVDLGHRFYHQPGELSGGEQQRVAFCRSLVMKPSLLLTDEITGNLDTKTGGNVHKLLFELNEKEKVTIVSVTHDNRLASDYSRRIEIVDGVIERDI